MFKKLYYWLFNIRPKSGGTADASLDPFRLTLFIVFHLLCLAAFWVGVSPVAILVALGLYFSRMFFITAFYHRYFSHRTFKVSRQTQFLLAVLGCTAGQRGPLWWASHHRHHHLYADQQEDAHSPRQGLLNSHMLWFFRKENLYPIEARIKDLLKYPELRWLEHFDWLPFVLLGAGCYLLGAALNAWLPALGTSGAQMLVWGFLISTVVLYHGTYTINSLAHRYGKRRYDTTDDSRNNFWLALLTLGEGWHNNHHRYPGATRQGFFWWEIDISYMLLSLMHKVGIVKSMHPVPARVLAEAATAPRGEAGRA